MVLSFTCDHSWPNADWWKQSFSHWTTLLNPVSYSRPTLMGWRDGWLINANVFLLFVHAITFFFNLSLQLHKVEQTLPMFGQANIRLLTTACTHCGWRGQMQRADGVNPTRLVSSKHFIKHWRQQRLFAPSVQHLFHPLGHLFGSPTRRHSKYLRTGMW